MKYDRHKLPNSRPGAYHTFAAELAARSKGGFCDLPDDPSFLIIPSFTDVHVHLREPGFFYKETIRSGTIAAAASGYGHIFSMPNLDPVPDSLQHLHVQRAILERDARIDVRPYGAITVGEKGERLADLEAMAPYVIGFSDDGIGLNDPALMREAMGIAKKFNLPIVAHCEDLALRNGGYIHDGDYARRHGHRGISSESEWRPIQRDLALVRETGCKYHVCHISTKESVELIGEAKARGLDVSCETAPHYLLLCDEELQEDGRFKMNPPIRSRADQEALLSGILDGTIDMIATDHAPHSVEEKSKGLADSAMGIVGLETAFPLLYTELVCTGVLSLERLVELMAIAPRRRFGLPDAEEAGDYAVWDIGRSYEINPENFYSKGRATPFAGRRVYGTCVRNVLGGRTVWDRRAERQGESPAGREQNTGKEDCI